jgi:transketolase
MACVLEVDREILSRYLALPLIVTYEDHNVHTGIVPPITRFLLEEKFAGRLLSFGVKKYGASGETEEALRLEGLDVDSVTAEIKRVFKSL